MQGSKPGASILQGLIPQGQNWPPNSLSSNIIFYCALPRQLQQHTISTPSIPVNKVHTHLENQVWPTKCGLCAAKVIPLNLYLKKPNGIIVKSNNLYYILLVKVMINIKFQRNYSAHDNAHTNFVRCLLWTVPIFKMMLSNGWFDPSYKNRKESYCTYSTAQISKCVFMEWKW